MDDDFATMSTYEQLEYRTGQLEAQRQISKLLNVRAERAEAERDAALAEVARLQRLKAVAVDIANDREHNEKRLEAEVARLRKAYSVTNAALRKTQDALTDRIDECHALCGPTVSALRDELTTVLEVAIARGAALGYDSDSDYIQRWEELTGDEWVEE